MNDAQTDAARRWEAKYHRLDERFMEVARLASQATRERDAALAAIENAPHHRDCDAAPYGPLVHIANGIERFRCTCWKSTALASRTTVDTEGTT